MRRLRGDSAHHRPAARAVPAVRPEGPPPHLEHQLSPEGLRLVRDRLRPRGVGQRPRQEGFERDQVGHEQRVGVQRRVEEQHEKHHRHRYGLRRHDAEDDVLRRPRSGRLVLVGIDTGGTFTDVVALVGGRIRVAKIRSTPEDPSRAVGEGLRALGVAPRSARLHYGTTVATNALLERRGARVVLVTTAGFEDVIEIGRQVRPSLYALEPRRPPPLVPRARRLGVAERVLADGRVERPLERRAVVRLVKAVLRHRPEAVAVSLLHSYAAPRHERLLARAFAARGVHLTLSHRLVREHREYERTATVVVNAYVGPLMTRHLGTLARAVSGGLRVRQSSGRLGTARPADPEPGHAHRPGPLMTLHLGTLARAVSGGLGVMQSSAGLVTARTAAAGPVHTILSGPAGGVVGATAAARRARLGPIVTLDMGGTSTDVSLVAGPLAYRTETSVDGLPVRVPALDIHTVGAGGGSLARLDPGGALRVGPESAGADPGPACYGRGAEPTVTDANLVLGRLVETDFLGGEMRLDRARAERAVGGLARRLGRALE